jgi:hypothetical protein
MQQRPAARKQEHRGDVVCDGLRQKDAGMMDGWMDDAWLMQTLTTPIFSNN